MSASQSNLSLDSYYLAELQYRIADGLETIPKPIEIVAPIALEVSESTTLLDAGDRTWRCELTVRSTESVNGENEFYSFKIITVGFFRVEPSLSVEQMTLLAVSNCPAVLYSTSREIIATVTRRSPYPPLLLPLVTFIKDVPKPKPAKKAVKKKAP